MYSIDYKYRLIEWINEWLNETNIANVFTYWFFSSLINEWMNLIN